MKKVVIFGAGDLGRCFYEIYKECFEILFFVDNRIYEPLKNVPVLHPEVLRTTEFDVVYIASAHGLQAIYKQLVNELGVPSTKINRVWGESHIPDFFINPRIRFLEDYAEYCYLHGMDGACAEVGVCRGDFAAEINRVFSDKKLYLYDTFEGFDTRDLVVEQRMNQNYSAINQWVNDGSMAFTDTSVEIVRNRLPFPEQVVIRKGFFPGTFDMNHDEKYVFVNLDTDLYQPIKDGLEIFYPRM
ncbi:MAG: nucleoside-diphosphate sugar epimerase/dehydratase, partial [Lachnospiraceae bacterium]